MYSSPSSEDVFSRSQSSASTTAIADIGSSNSSCFCFSSSIVTNDVSCSGSVVGCVGASRGRQGSSSSSNNNNKNNRRCRCPGTGRRVVSISNKLETVVSNDLATATNLISKCQGGATVAGGATATGAGGVDDPIWVRRDMKPKPRYTFESEYRAQGSHPQQPRLDSPSSQIHAKVTPPPKLEKRRVHSPADNPPRPEKKLGRRPAFYRDRRRDSQLFEALESGAVNLEVAAGTINDCADSDCTSSLNSVSQSPPLLDNADAGGINDNSNTTIAGAADGCGGCDDESSSSSSVVVIGDIAICDDDYSVNTAPRILSTDEDVAAAAVITYPISTSYSGGCGVNHYESIADGDGSAGHHYERLSDVQDTNGHVRLAMGTAVDGNFFSSNDTASAAASSPIATTDTTLTNTNTAAPPFITTTARVGPPAPPPRPPHRVSRGALPLPHNSRASPPQLPPPLACGGARARSSAPADSPVSLYGLLHRLF